MASTLYWNICCFFVNCCGVMNVRETIANIHLRPMLVWILLNRDRYAYYLKIQFRLCLNGRRNDNVNVETKPFPFAYDCFTSIIIIVRVHVSSDLYQLIRRIFKVYKALKCLTNDEGITLLCIHWNIFNAKDHIKYGLLRDVCLNEVTLGE